MQIYPFLSPFKPCNTKNEWATHPIFCVPDSGNKINLTPILYSVSSCPK